VSDKSIWDEPRHFNFPGEEQAALELRALELKADQDFRRARNAFSRILELDPYDGNTYQELIRCSQALFLISGDERLLADYELALDHLTDTELLIAAATEFYRAGKRDLARRAAVRYVRIKVVEREHPDAFATAHRMCNDRVGSGEWPNVVEAIESAALESLDFTLQLASSNYRLETGDPFTALNGYIWVADHNTSDKLHRYGLEGQDRLATSALIGAQKARTQILDIALQGTNPQAIHAAQLKLALAREDLSIHQERLAMRAEVQRLKREGNRFDVERYIAGRTDLGERCALQFYAEHKALQAHDIQNEPLHTQVKRVAAALTDELNEIQNAITSTSHDHPVRPFISGAARRPTKLSGLPDELRLAMPFSVSTDHCLGRLLMQSLNDAFGMISIGELSNMHPTDLLLECPLGPETFALLRETLASHDVYMLDDDRHQPTLESDRASRDVNYGLTDPGPRAEL
jgi:hypothetical protein